MRPPYHTTSGCGGCPAITMRRLNNSPNTAFWCIKHHAPFIAIGSATGSKQNLLASGPPQRALQSAAKGASAPKAASPWALRCSHCRQGPGAGCSLKATALARKCSACPVGAKARGSFAIPLNGGSPEEKPKQIDHGTTSA